MAHVIKQLHCERCGYDWYPSSPEPPKTCTRCKSYRWMTPKAIRVPRKEKANA